MKTETVRTSNNSPVVSVSAYLFALFCFDFFFLKLLLFLKKEKCKKRKN